MDCPNRFPRPFCCRGRSSSQPNNNSLEMMDFVAEEGTECDRYIRYDDEEFVETYSFQMKSRFVMDCPISLRRPFCCRGMSSSQSNNYSSRSSSQSNNYSLGSVAFEAEEGIDCDRYIRDDNEEFLGTDSFQMKVEEKTETLSISQKEAELEVVTDTLIYENGSVDFALLHLLHWVRLESKALPLVDNLIRRGANVSTSNGCSNPLSYAVERSFIGVAAKLLKQYDEQDFRARIVYSALMNAIEVKQDDDMSALIISHMPKSHVRELTGGNSELLTFLLKKSNMKKTVLSLLDCMIESDDSGDNIRFYYHIIESDLLGRPPNDPEFIGQYTSPLHIIARQGNKSIVNHDVVRRLIRRKWDTFAKKIFQWMALLYMLTLFCLTFSGIVAAMTPDPLRYDSPLQVARAVFEIASVCMAVQLLVSEIYQLKRHRLKYFTDGFNYADFPSAILILCVIPLRYTENNAQWHVFAFGYLFWIIRIFEYALVFRRTGAYVQALFQILSHDFIPFGAVFTVILLAFSGSFFLALRGDSELDIHDETSTFWGILFVGVRTLTEAQPVVEYTGEDGYGTVSVIFMMCFLFTCYVILLNILIAQLTGTYQKVQQDAQRWREVNRAWIVARVELYALFFGQDFRKTHYKEYEDYNDTKNLLTKGDSPPITEMNKYIRDNWDSSDNQKMNILQVQHRLARQEKALLGIQARLDRLIRLHPRDSHHNKAEPSTSVKLNDETDTERDSDIATVNVDEITVLGTHVWYPHDGGASDKHGKNWTDL